MSGSYAGPRSFSSLWGQFSFEELVVASGDSSNTAKAVPQKFPEANAKQVHLIMLCRTKFILLGLVVPPPRLERGTS